MPILHKQEEEHQRILVLPRPIRRYQYVPNYRSINAEEEIILDELHLEEDDEEEEEKLNPKKGNRIQGRQLCTSLFLLCGGGIISAAIWFYLIPLIFHESIVHYSWNYQQFGGESMHLHIALQHRFSYLWFQSLIIQLQRNQNHFFLPNATTVPAIAIEMSEEAKNELELSQFRVFTSPLQNITEFSPLLREVLHQEQQPVQSFATFFYPIHLTRQSTIQIQFTSISQDKVPFLFFVISGNEHWNEFINQWKGMTKKTSLRNLLALEDLMAHASLFYTSQQFTFTATSSEMHYFWIQPVSMESQCCHSLPSTFFSVQFSVHYFYYTLAKPLYYCNINMTHPYCTIPVPFALPWNIQAYDMIVNQPFHSTNIAFPPFSLTMEWTQRFWFTIPLSLSPFLCCWFIVIPIFIYQCCCKKV